MKPDIRTRIERLIVRVTARYTVAKLTGRPVDHLVARSNRLSKLYLKNQ